MIARKNSGGYPSSVVLFRRSLPDNVQRRMKSVVILLSLIATSLAFAGSHLDKAQELYKKGPSAADQIIAELNLELADDPGNETALLLLAITQRGMARFDDSLATLERVEKLNQKQKVLKPELYMLRTENFFYKKDYKKTRQLLDAYWGIFDTSDRLKAKSKALSEAVEKALKEEAQSRSSSQPGAGSS